MAYSVLISGYHEIVSLYKLDQITGALTLEHESTTVKDPSYMDIDKHRRLAFAVSEGVGTFSSFRLEDSGHLSLISTCSAEGSDSCHVTLHNSGKWAIVSNYGSGTLTVVRVDDDGSVHTHQVLTPGKNVHQAVFDDTYKYLFVPCLGSDYVAQYVFDATTGHLTANTEAAFAQLAKGAGPRHLAFHPTGEYVYVMNELDATLTRFRYDKTCGIMTDPHTVSTLPDGANKEGVSTAHIAVSPDGRFVYGSNRGHDSLVIYEINKEDGTLRAIGWENAGGQVKKPRDFALTPCGKWLICANQASSTLIVFKRSESTGLLEVVGVHPSGENRGPCYVGIF